MRYNNLIFFINHPVKFMQGARVLYLVGRNKDGCIAKRKIFRISHNEKQYERIIDEFTLMAHKGERIYSSLCKRSIQKASRLFKERQLASEYSDKPEDFYKCLNRRWCSCLMNPKISDEKLWLFDCDNDLDYKEVEKFALELKAYSYSYKTKSGWHVITTPFNLMNINNYFFKLLDRNALMLIGY